MEKIITNTDAMGALAQEVLTELLSQKTKNDSGATVLGLSGELGAGKTAFAKAFAHALDITESVPSPTFVLAKFYSIPSSTPFRRLVHVDAYRIESLDELRPLGWSKLLADPANLVLVEWPEKLGAEFPHDAGKLSFKVVDETTRSVSIEI